MLLLLACASAPVAPTPAPPPQAAPTVAPTVITAPAPERLVAIGDLHGDTVAAIRAMKLAGVVDDAGHWTGGKSWLVQTGDITDRGPDSKGVIALMRQLQSEAQAAGGRVVPLLGNHETMNVLGDWRYVSPEDLSGYGGEAQRKQAFSATGEDGQWLRGLDAVALVGDTVFMHGGLDAHWASVGITAINLQVRAAMDDIAGAKAPVLGPDGPLWNRSFVLSDEATACPQLKEALATIGAKRMVVGHTVQESGQIGVRCEGQLYAIDTGNSAYYGNHTSALEIQGHSVTPLQ